jgi:hypothetical protein
MFRPAMVVATPAKTASRSRRRYAGASRSGKVLRSCCAVQALVGSLVDGHVDDPSMLVREDDEHEEHPERDGRHDEEVDGHDLGRVIGEKRSPRL